METSTYRRSWKTLLAFAIIYFVWGSTFLAIRIGVHEIPPLVMAAMRFTAAGLVLYLWMIARGEPSPSARQWTAASLLAIPLFVMDYGLLFWAEQRVPSGVAAVMLATIPAFMALSEIIFLRTQKLTVRLAAALLIGCGGVAVLMSRSLALGGAPIDRLGAVALIVASLSWSVSSAFTRKLPLPPSKAMSSGVQMLAGGVFLAIVAARVRRVSRFSSFRRFARGVVFSALPDRLRLDHRVHRLHLAHPPRIADEGRHVRVCESGGGGDARIFPRRRSARPANHSRRSLHFGQRNRDHHHAREKARSLARTGRHRRSHGLVTCFCSPPFPHVLIAPFAPAAAGSAVALTQCSERKVGFGPKFAARMPVDKQR